MQLDLCAPQPWQHTSPNLRCHELFHILPNDDMPLITLISEIPNVMTWMSNLMKNGNSVADGFDQGCQTHFTRVHISLEVAFKGLK